MLQTFQNQHGNESLACSSRQKNNCIFFNSNFHKGHLVVPGLEVFLIIVFTHDGGDFSKSNKAVADGGTGTGGLCQWSNSGLGSLGLGLAFLLEIIDVAYSTNQKDPRQPKKKRRKNPGNHPGKYGYTMSCNAIIKNK